MNLSLGYLKDKFAVFLFLFSIYFIYIIPDLNRVRILLLIGFILAFIVDSIFTLYPDLHNMHIDIFKNKYKKYFI